MEEYTPPTKLEALNNHIADLHSEVAHLNRTLEDLKNLRWALYCQEVAPPITIGSDETPNSY